MKILQKVGVALVCLTLIATFGCKDNKKASASPSNAKTSATNKQNSSSPAKTNAATSSSTAAATASATNAASTSKPGNSGPKDGGFTSEEPLLFNLFTADQAEIVAATKIPIQMDSEDKTFAGQFYATTTVNYIETFCPSWDNSTGNLTLSLYNWKDNYETTVAGKAIMSKEFVDYKDNEWLQLKFETPLPAGEYLWVLSNPVETVGIWDVAAGPEGQEDKVINYVGGAPSDTFHVFRIQYTKTPKVTLADLSK